mgnify:CR=1
MSIGVYAKVVDYGARRRGHRRIEEAGAQTVPRFQWKELSPDRSLCDPNMQALGLPARPRYCRHLRTRLARSGNSENGM